MGQAKDKLKQVEDLDPETTVGNRERRVARLAAVSTDRRLLAYRRGYITDAMAIAELVADLGKEERVDAEWDLAKLLDHPHPIVRCNALGALGFDFGSKLRIGRMMDMARNDPDADCRRTAAAVLGSLFFADRNASVLLRLYTIASDPREDADVRVFAYFGILRVVGIPSRDTLGRKDHISESDLEHARSLIRDAVGVSVAADLD